MLYRKIRISHQDDKKRLYRLLYVPDNLCLGTLADIILKTFRTGEEHLYEFRKGKASWKSPYFGDFDPYEDRDMYACDIHDPGDTYTFWYDFGDDWMFEIRVYKAAKEIDSSIAAIVIEGKGLGIWEDNRWGYMQLLSGEMPEDLSEDNEAEDMYLPWNLNLEKAGDTFADIDPDEETAYLDSCVDASEEYDPDEGIWGKFNDLYDNAFIAEFGKSADRAERWADAWDEFLRILSTLREEDALPARFTDLTEEYSAFAGMEFMIELTRALERAEMGEKLWEMMDEAEKMFGDLSFWEGWTVAGKASALKAMGRYDELLSYAKDAHEKDPENYNVTAVLLDAYRLNKKKKDGRILLEKFLEDKPECSDETVKLFITALEFAEFAGLKTIVHDLNKELSRYDRGMAEEDDEYDGGYEYDDDEDEDGEAKLNATLNSLALGRLSYACENYLEDYDENYYSDIMKRLTEILLAEGFIWMCVKQYEDDSISINNVADPDTGEEYISVYSSPELCENDGYDIIPMPLEGVLEAVDSFKVTGLAIDASLPDDFVKVPRKQTHKILRFYRDLLDFIPE